MRFGLSIPPLALSPYVILSLFPKRSVDCERYHMNDALGATIRGARTRLTERLSIRRL